MNPQKSLHDFAFVPMDLPRLIIEEGKTKKFLIEHGFSSKILEKHQDHSYETDIGGVGVWKYQYSMRYVDLPNHYQKVTDQVKGQRDTFKDALTPNLPWKWTDNEVTPDLVPNNKLSLQWQIFPS